MICNWLNPWMRHNEFRGPTMGPDHPWILVSVEGPGTNPLWILRDDCIRCHDWEELGEGCMGPFCTIFAAPCKSVIISKWKVRKKQTNQNLTAWPRASKFPCDLSCPSWAGCHLTHQAIKLGTQQHATIKWKWYIWSWAQADPEGTRNCMISSWPWPLLLRHYLLSPSPTYSFTVTSLWPVGWRGKLLGSAWYASIT